MTSANSSNPLPVAQQRALLAFLGYGNPTAETVFLGMGEGFVKAPPLEEQLAIRATFAAPLVDLAVAAAVHPEKYVSAARPPLHPTWNVMIRVLLALEGKRDVLGEDMSLFQRDRLGRTHESSALLELLPLPSANIATWCYAEYFPQFPTRDRYVAALLEARIRDVQRHLAYGPRLVIAYGEPFWDAYRRVFPSVRAWSERAPFQFADVGEMRIILTPRMTSRAMNASRGELIRLACESKSRARAIASPSLADSA